MTADLAVNWSDPAVAGTIDDGEVVVVRAIAQDPQTGSPRLHLDDGSASALL